MLVLNIIMLNSYDQIQIKDRSFVYTSMGISILVNSLIELCRIVYVCMRSLGLFFFSKSVILFLSTACFRNIL